jgi:hypothetical protein
MNDPRFDARLVAATNRRSDDTNTFVKQTMLKVSALEPAKPKPAFWRLAFAHRVAFGIVAIVMVSMLAFTGYAYAIGSDPLSLLKRWIEGDKVKIEYDGRVFEHGKSHTYSDAAITAYAELNTVSDLAFRAMNAFTIPKDGVEHISDIYDTDYVYPVLATIEKVEGPHITLAQRYLAGDKMNPSRELDTPMVTNLGSFKLYKKGEPATPTNEDKGTLVKVFVNKYIAHTIGTDRIKRVKIHFAFALSHKLQDFIEADKANAEGLKPASDAEQPLYEPGWGGISSVCLNNGADACTDGKLSTGKGEGLYDVTGEHGRRMNYDAVAYGEGVPLGESQPMDLVQRNLEGKIVAIDNTHFTLETSSGAKWRLEYPQAKRTNFAKVWGRPLAVGDRLAGMILQSVRNLDDRTADDKHMSQFVRI